MNVAFVVQRYGFEVNGGAELHARQLAEKLAQYHNVEVITTCSMDFSYNNWDNYYKEGTDVVSNIPVHRFRTQKIGEVLRLPAPASFSDGYIKDMIWLWEQGPFCPELIDYIRYNGDNYDVFIFMTYLFFTTVAGMACVPGKSILIPTAHDEASIRRNIFMQTFHLPRAVFYNSEEEKSMVEERFSNEYIVNDVGGIGVDVPSVTNGDRFRKKYNIKNKFILYAGRIASEKGCDTLFEYFIRYKNEFDNDVELVLLGKGSCPVPSCDDIKSVGFISEEDKFDAINACEFVVIPSKYESLSMILLEGMSMGKPVLVNGGCDVLRAHCKKSNAGIYYYDYNEFVCGIEFLLDKKKREALCGNAAEYVEKNYNWDVIINKLQKLMERI